MKIVIAPDSFKGSLTSSQVCDIAANAAREVFPDAAVQKLPLADGGEGTAEALMNVLPGEIRTLQVRGPLGTPVTARYGIVPSAPIASARETPEHPLPKTKIAIMDMAGASGLTLVPEAERDVFHFNTFGTGEMILDAISQGCGHIYLGLGGSATSDGGMGMAAALGAVFRDENGMPLDPVPASMHRIAAVDVSRLNPAVSRIPITVMSDVKNPLLGPEGAVYVYGPQKGIPAKRLADMDQAMAHYIDCVESALPKKSIRHAPGSGAAGGLGAGLLAFTRSEISSGIETVLKLLEFDACLESADLVITGEGRMDFQSAYGKVVAGVAAHCKTHQIPCFALAGSIEDGAEALYDFGISGMMPLVDRIESLDSAIRDAEKNCFRAAVRLLRIVKAGMEVRG